MEVGTRSCFRRNHRLNRLAPDLDGNLLVVAFQLQIFFFRLTRRIPDVFFELRLLLSASPRKL